MYRTARKYRSLFVSPIRNFNTNTKRRQFAFKVEFTPCCNYFVCPGHVSFSNGGLRVGRLYVSTYIYCHQLHAVCTFAHRAHSYTQHRGIYSSTNSFAVVSRLPGNDFSRGNITKSVSMLSESAMTCLNYFISE